MKQFFYWFFKFLFLLTGIASGAVGALLCKQGNKDWGWFVFIGFIVIVGTAMWSAIAEMEGK